MSANFKFWLDAIELTQVLSILEENQNYVKQIIHTLNPEIAAAVRRQFEFLGAAIEVSDKIDLTTKATLKVLNATSINHLKENPNLLVSFLDHYKNKIKSGEIPPSSLMDKKTPEITSAVSGALSNPLDLASVHMTATPATKAAAPQLAPAAAPALVAAAPSSPLIKRLSNVDSPIKLLQTQMESMQAQMVEMQKLMSCMEADHHAKIDRVRTELEFEIRRGHLIRQLEYTVEKWSKQPVGDIYTKKICETSLLGHPFWMNIKKNSEGSIGLYICTDPRLPSFRVDYQIAVVKYDVEESLDSRFRSAVCAHQFLTKFDGEDKSVWGVRDAFFESILIREGAYNPEKEDKITFFIQFWPSGNCAPITSVSPMVECEISRAERNRVMKVRVEVERLNKAKAEAIEKVRLKEIEAKKAAELAKQVIESAKADLRIIHLANNVTEYAKELAKHDERIKFLTDLINKQQLELEQEQTTGKGNERALFDINKAKLERAKENRNNLEKAVKAALSIGAAAPAAPAKAAVAPAAPGSS